VDRAGDATQVVLVDTPLPTQPSLDITKAFLTYDAAAESLTFTIAVTDLTAGPPAGSLGEFFSSAPLRHPGWRPRGLRHREPARDHRDVLAAAAGRPSPRR
jgi:hypothetical protein